MTRPLWFHGGVRRRQGAAAVVAAIVAVGAVAGVTAHQSSQVQAVPAPQMPAPVERIAEVDADVEAVESVSPELEGETLTPSAEPSTQTFSLPDVPLFPTFHYSEDPYLPRPVGDDEIAEVGLGDAGVQGNGALATPVKGRRTSPFGMRMHPVLHVYKLHTGLDWAAPCGTPIGAAADGVVTRVGWAGGNGYMVTIAHGEINGYQVVTNYGHMSSFAVRVGDRVKRQQGIGRVGNTGYSTGCHLHFEVKADGQFTDPASWLEEGAAIVFADDMQDVPVGDEPSPSPSPSPSDGPTDPGTPSESPSDPGSGSPSPSPSPSPSESGSTSPLPSPSPSPTEDPSGEPTDPSDPGSGSPSTDPSPSDPPAETTPPADPSDPGVEPTN